MKFIWALLPLMTIGALFIGTASALAQPTIEDVRVVDITRSSAVITWSTEISGDSVVHYGTDEDYGFTMSDPSLVSEHAIVLADLLPNTRYFFNVQSADSDGNTALDDNDGKSYSFKTESVNVGKKTFVGTVVDNSTTTVTLLSQGKEEQIRITLPNAFTLKTPGGPRAGTFDNGAKVVIRATLAGDSWVAESVLVKPVRPDVPVIGVVIESSETTMTVMTQEGSTYTFELADDTGKPSQGEVLTVFQGASSRAKGLVRTEDVDRRLQEFLESAIDEAEMSAGEGNLETRRAVYLGQLLEDHGARQAQIIEGVLIHAPDAAKDGISKSRQRVETATQAARDAVNRAKSSLGPQTNNNHKPAAPPGLSDDADKNPSQGPPDDRGNDGGGKGDIDKNPGQGPPDDRGNDGGGKGDIDKNPGQGPPDDKGKNKNK